MGISEAAAGLKKPRVYWEVLFCCAVAKFECMAKLTSPSKSRTTLNLPIFAYSTVESALVTDSYQKAMYSITSPLKPGKIPTTTKVKTQKNHVEENNHIYIESLSLICNLIFQAYNDAKFHQKMMYSVIVPEKPGNFQ